jgi:hypothetical protein
MNPKRLAGLLLLVVFCAGIALGVAADRLLRSERPPRTMLGSSMAGVLDRLDLTPEQRSRAETILQRHTPRTEDLMAELATRLAAESDSLDAELRALLSTAQRELLDSLRTRQPIVLRRKQPGPGGTSVVDTIFPPRTP